MSRVSTQPQRPIAKQDYASTGWLQAFIGSPIPSIQEARLKTKKHLDAIECLSSLTTIREKRDSVGELVQSVWDHANRAELGWLIRIVPSQASDWILDGCDDFTIHTTTPRQIDSSDAWIAAMGIRDWKTTVTMMILKGDFVTWQRRVARQGNSGQSLGFTYEVTEKSNLELATTASWKANDWFDGVWSFEINGQPMMQKNFEEPITTQRPELASLMDELLMTVSYADKEIREQKNVVKTPALSESILSGSGTIPTWCDSVPLFKPMHDSVMRSSDMKFSPRLQYVWSTVWPILYCRWKKLRRESVDLATIRQQLDHCFQHEPELTRWLFIFGELLTQIQIGDGLGIAAKYKSL